jgi:hypothetical protein
VFKVNEGIGRPETLADLFPRHHLAGPLEERGENLEGSLLELDLSPLRRTSPHRRSTSNSPTRKRAIAMAGTCMAGSTSSSILTLPLSQTGVNREAAWKRIDNATVLLSAYQRFTWSLYAVHGFQRSSA